MWLFVSKPVELVKVLYYLEGMKNCPHVNSDSALGGCWFFPLMGKKQSSVWNDSSLLSILRKQTEIKFNLLYFSRNIKARLISSMQLGNVVVIFIQPLNIDF